MKTRAQLAGLAMLAAACSSRSVDSPGPQSTPGHFDAVSLHRSACYGRCPVYTVEIRADGQVTYSGEQDVKVQGTRRSSIPPADVELLAAALRHVKFEEMRERYQFGADGCVDLVTDFPSLSIAVTTAGKTKTVGFYTGCRGPSVPAQELVWLAGTIDVMARTQAQIATESRP